MLAGAGAVVSDDHAGPSLHTAALLQSTSPSPVHLFSIVEVKENDGSHANKPFYCVIDGMVVDATSFVNAHPGGLKKILSTDDASVGATGKAFGFSFSKGPECTFPWNRCIRDTNFPFSFFDNSGTRRTHTPLEGGSAHPVSVPSSR